MASLSFELSFMAVLAANLAALASLIACFNMSLSLTHSRCALSRSSSACFMQLTNPISFPFQAKRVSSASNLTRSAAFLCTSISFFASSKSFFCLSSISATLSFNLAAEAKVSIAFLLFSSASVAIFNSFSRRDTSSVKCLIFNEASSLAAVSPLLDLEFSSSIDLIFS
nr:hypothetical protein Iba_chr02bCG4490 [Ipomoea batatas]